MAADTVKLVKLNSGHVCPMIGLGTWKSPKEQVQAAVECAIDVGYRHIDCAYIYRNETEVGDGIQVKINQGKVKREDLFIVSKLWNYHHHPKDVLPALKETLSNLKLQYLDLYLIHWPFGDSPEGEEDTDYVETWKAMEKLVDEGLVKSIGVSNFNQYQLKRIINECKIIPANNQIECHPYFAQEELLKFCHDNGVFVTAYSPLGSGDNPFAPKSNPVLLEEPIIVEIAQELKKTPAQIVLRFQIQRGIVVVPKSVTPSRIASNFQIFDFELSKEQMRLIGEITTRLRICTFTSAKHKKYYAFREGYQE